MRPKSPREVGAPRCLAVFTALACRRRERSLLWGMMKAVMLAAGIGARLGSAATEHPPRILPRLGGKSMAQFHSEILRRRGVAELALGVGYHHQDIKRANAEVLPRNLTAGRNRRAAMMIERDMTRGVAQGP